MKWSDKGQGFLRKNHSGELESMLRFAPNASTYLAMYVRKKALLSAQIERGADYFILACTELPILAAALGHPGPFVDPTLELAKAAIRFCGYGVK